ncbi:hypothetical protein GP486_005023 [Trichoglossum hirsutum]|uniref:Uncharacterized protein n=1 Tax=Trichoglossum hirsutum TaxID=265104 RepID=A0A9P8RNK8_9PEZI|nr:hypothetical protein GP486_005023 [Trichoglossum hirsutum]
MPEGVLHLSWYHNTSPRLYSDMRFLVSPSQEYELVIGARSILKHKLVSYPNFGMTSVQLITDKSRDKLTQAEAKLSNELNTLRRDRAEGLRANKIDKVKKLDKAIKKKEESIRIKRLEIDQYDAKK